MDDLQDDAAGLDMDLDDKATKILENDPWVVVTLHKVEQDPQMSHQWEVESPAWY